MMTVEHHLSSSTPTTDKPAPLASLWSGFAGWMMVCADSYAAWAIYHDLSRLSDAELRRRGLRRDTLAREAFEFCERRD